MRDANFTAMCFQPHLPKTLDDVISNYVDDASDAPNTFVAFPLIKILQPGNFLHIDLFRLLDPMKIFFEVAEINAKHELGHFQRSIILPIVIDLLALGDPGQPQCMCLLDKDSVEVLRGRA